MKNRSHLALFLELVRLFKPYTGWILLGMLLSLVTLLANVGLLALSGWFITAMALAGLANTDMDYFTPGAAIRGLAIARTGGRYLERLVTHEATFRITAKLRLWFYQHIEPLAPAGLQGLHSGDLLRRIRADIDHLENFYLRVFSPVVVAIIASLVVLIFLAFFDIRLVLIEAALLITAGLLIPLRANKASREPGKKLVEDASQLQETTIDSLQGMDELQIYGADKRYQQNIQHSSDKVLKTQTRLASINSVSLGSTLLFGNLAMWLMVLIAIPAVSSGELQASNLPMLALLALASFEIVAPLPLAFQLLPQTLTAAERIFAILDRKPAITEPDTPTAVPQHFDIRFRNVGFAYPDSGMVLDDFNLELKQGERIALTAESGRGKTTVSHLLLRFWEHQRGEILINDEPITHFDSEQLRQRFSMVSQHSYLFNSTIRRNLLLANQDASEDQIIAACQKAEIHDFVSSLEDGYDSWIGEAGMKLSGGQIQRLCIARALLKPAAVLILDEPTESLDAETENRVLDNLLTSDNEQSIILITHKRAGLDKINRIVHIN